MLEERGRVTVESWNRTVEVTLAALGDDHKIPRTKAHPGVSRARSMVSIERPRLTMMLGDPHYPIHDEQAIGAVLNLARDLGVDHYVVSDAVDFFSLSTYAKDAERVLGGSFTVWSEAESAQPFWRELLADGARVDLVPGNHEHRLRRFVDLNPGLYDHPSFDLENVLALPEGVVCHEYRAQLRIGSLVIEHGDQLRGALTKHGPATVVDRYPHQSTVYGHTHRLASARVTSWGPNGPVTRFAASAGHLSSIRKQTWISDPVWQSGAVLLEHHEGGCSHHLIQVEGGAVRFGGKVYR